jgi:hypothetical protein
MIRQKIASLLLLFTTAMTSAQADKDPSTGFGYFPKNIFRRGKDNGSIVAGWFGRQLLGRMNLR